MSGTVLRTLIALGVLALIAILSAEIALHAPRAAAQSDDAYAAARELHQTLARDADPHTDPCRDFYRHVCGGWLAQQDQQRDESVFQELEDEIDARIQAMAEDGWPIISTWYSTCRDGARRRANGMTSLHDLYVLVDSVQHAADVLPVLGQLHRAGVSAFFSALVAPDPDNTSVSRLYLDWAETLVPYEVATAPSQPQNNESRLYSEWAQRVALAVLDNSQTAAAAALSIEAQLVEAMRRSSDYELRTWTPDAYIAQLLTGLRTQAPLDVFAADGGYINAALQAATARNDMQSVRAYLRLRCAAAVLDALPPPPPYQDESSTAAAAAHTCVSSLRRWLAPVLSHYYAASFSSGQARAAATTMLENVLGATDALLQTVQWMDAPTRAAALRKLHEMRPLIGYPERWDTLISADLVHPGDHLGNALRVLEATAGAQLRKLDVVAAQQRYEWKMASYDVNAYYDPRANDIVFPAGIVQRPFFNLSAPAAANYGGLGTVMGHEVNHAFDDTGRRFDWDGALRDWWSAQSAAAYEVRAQCVVQLYENRTVEQGISVNGELTLGENWADINGLRAAFIAFEQERRTLGNNERARRAELVQRVFGHSEEQLFFRSWAHHWCAHTVRVEEYVLALTDTHAPPEWRVNVPAMQSAEFRAAFGCRRDARVEQCELFRRRK